MSTFVPIGMITSLLFIAVIFFVAYLVIQAAVRNGIDSSELGKQLKQKIINDRSDDEN
ncbi:hypothetical protein ACLIBG_15115 [Virgibacillus sp. W0181]|uniref:hypothetical protein n=1 Tax=Virgibacillus sp. W0181 TaxID=3391581 RepID=UPI003F478DF3